jgi:rSAM/selenodomain-associated transferase 2
LKLSVIIPVLNEAELIRGLVVHLRARLPQAELLFVDGGSDDGTGHELEKLAEEYPIRLLHSRRGRAPQMNIGALASTGEILLFLHADSRLPHDCEQAMAELFARPNFLGGCFRLRFPRREWIYRISDSLGNFAVDLFQIALGDHGIFCRQEVFFAIGGFPEVPLLEDAEFYRALQRHGRVRQLRVEIETSPRRYEEHGRYRTTFFYLSVLLLYLAGMKKERLARWHARFTRQPPMPRASRSTREIAQPVDPPAQLQPTP